MILTESDKFPVSIVKSNKQWGGGLACIGRSASSF